MQFFNLINTITEANIKKYLEKLNGHIKTKKPLTNYKNNVQDNNMIQIENNTGNKEKHRKS